MELDPERSTLSVWTHKAGLLARAAHDLRLDATGWRLEVRPDGEGAAVEVRAPVAGLRVAGQVHADGRVEPLSARDHAEIEENVRRKVFDAGRHPEIAWSGRVALPLAPGRTRATGRLTLQGATREVPLDLEVRPDDAAPGAVRVEGRVRLLQTDFGIRPYSALMGALKLEDALDVSWSVVLRG